MAQDAGLKTQDSGVKGKGKKALCVLFALITVHLAPCALHPGVEAADATETTTPAAVHKTQEGLHFKVPEDWPIEKRNGVLGPIPIEEYLARKFSGIEHRLQELEKQITGLDLRLRVMEESAKSAKRRLQSGESVQP